MVDPTKQNDAPYTRPKRLSSIRRAARSVGTRARAARGVQELVPLDLLAALLEHPLHLPAVSEVVGHGEREPDPFLGQRCVVSGMEVEAMIERCGDEPLQLDGWEGPFGLRSESVLNSHGL